MNQTNTTYRQTCPRCQKHYPAYLFRQIQNDVMGDPHHTINICPKCERQETTNKQTTRKDYTK